MYKYIVFPLVKLFYNHADRIIAQNTAIRDDLIRHFGLRKELFTIIYNGTDGKAIEKISQRPLEKDDATWFSREKTIVTAGRLT